MGIDVKIETIEQANLIDRAIARDYQAMVFRNYPGGDPDLNYVWWYGKGNPVNFGGWDDPETSDLLDAGRSEPDPAKRKAIYQDVNRRMATQVFGMWAWFTPWAVVTAPRGAQHLRAAAPRRGSVPARRGDHRRPGTAAQPGPGHHPLPPRSLDRAVAHRWLSRAGPSRPVRLTCERTTCEYSHNDWRNWRWSSWWCPSSPPGS